MLARLNQFQGRHCRYSLMISEEALNNPESEEYREASSRVLVWRKEGVMLDDIVERCGVSFKGKVQQMSLRDVIRMIKTGEARENERHSR